MNRISFTIDKETLELLNNWVNSDFELEYKGNRSAYLNNLINQYVPEIEE